MENRKIKVTAVDNESLYEFCTLVQKTYKEFGNGTRTLLNGECHLAFDQVPVDIDRNEYSVGMAVSAMLNTNTKTGVIMQFINAFDFDPEECMVLTMAIKDYAMERLGK